MGFIVIESFVVNLKIEASMMESFRPHLSGEDGVFIFLG